MIEMLHLQSAPHSSDQESQNDSNSLDPRVLSSILISAKLAQIQDDSNDRDPHSRLLELMHSSPIRAILDAAVTFSRSEGIAPHDGLQQIVSGLQEIDRLWNRVLIKEGLNRLGSQYH